jgi:hypothetical protein
MNSGSNVHPQDPSKTSRDASKTVSESIEVDAPAERLYDMVSDVTRMGEWSPETRRCTWLGGATGPAVGARFKGVNQLGGKKWGIVSVVTHAEPGVRFEFDATAGPIHYATWTYSFESTGSGTRVTETCVDRRGPILNFVGGLISGVKDRSKHNPGNIQATLTALKKAAESNS